MRENGKRKIIEGMISSLWKLKLKASLKLSVFHEKKGKTERHLKVKRESIKRHLLCRDEGKMKTF
jgi:hypothetical protein